MPTKCELCEKTVRPKDSTALQLYAAKVKNAQQKMYRHKYGECR